MWTIHDKAMAANRVAQVGNRPVTGEPLYIMFVPFLLSASIRRIDTISFPVSISYVDFPHSLCPNAAASLSSTDRIVEAGADHSAFSNRDSRLISVQSILTR